LSACVSVILQAAGGGGCVNRRRAKCDVHQLERTPIVQHEIDEVSAIRRMFIYLLVHPQTIVFGADLCFTADVYFLFICFVTAPSVDLRKILHFDLAWAEFYYEFYYAGLKFQRTLLKKFRGQKHARFWTTLNLDSKYLWNR